MAEVTRSRQRALGRALAGPGRERDQLLQILKSAAAAVAAWQVSRLLLHSDQPFLAPLAALITVHATVYRSVRSAAELSAAILAGVMLAFLTARLLGVQWWSLGLVLVVALVVARWHRLGDNGLQVPITALLAMTIAGGVRDTALEARFVESLLGAAIGAATNLLLFPPVHLRSSRDAVASSAGAVSRLLATVAAGVRDGWDTDAAQHWLDRSRRLDAYVRQARLRVDEGRESLRLNPRINPADAPVDGPALSRAVDALEHVAVQCRSICSTLLEVAGNDPRGPSAEFRASYAQVLVDVAAAFDTLADDEHTDDERELLRSAVHEGGDRWRDLRASVAAARSYESERLPTYGSLLTDAERILDELERAEDCLAVSTP